MISERDIIKFDDYMIRVCTDLEIKGIWIDIKTELSKISLEDDLLFKTSLDLMRQLLLVQDDRALNRAIYFADELIKKCKYKKENDNVQTGS